jgi:protocatechuate 3,4-dioxygenase beta subunit
MPSGIMAASGRGGIVNGAGVQASAPMAVGGSPGSITAGRSAVPGTGGTMPTTAGGGAGTPAISGAGGSSVLAGGSGGSAGMSGSAMRGDTVPDGWAMGGTKAIQGTYPDPFGAVDAGMMCRLYPRQTLGPCYANGPMMRKDISDGQEGLPLRLSFLVVGEGCKPVPNATVDIWHSGREGTYSALSSPLCNPSGMSTLAENFCRGVQPTDEAGRVDFDSIFPGWYFLRTIHIHFTVRVDGRAVTSQLYFEDALTDEILAQGGYETRGRRSVRNASDMEFRTGGATPEQVTFVTAKRSDGALHAWKVLSIG